MFTSLRFSFSLLKEFLLFIYSVFEGFRTEDVVHCVTANRNCVEFIRRTVSDEIFVQMSFNLEVLLMKVDVDMFLICKCGELCRFWGYFYTNNKTNLIEFWVICPFLEQIHFLLLYTLTPDNWFESFSYYLHCRSHDAPESKSHINLFYWQWNKKQNIYCSKFL